MRPRYQEGSAGQPVVKTTESRDQVPPPSNVFYRIGRVFDPDDPSCILATQLVLRGGIGETAPQDEKKDYEPELDDECEFGAFSDFEPDDEDPDQEPDENSARVPPCISQPLESTSSLDTAFTDRIIDGPNIVSKELNFALIETVETDEQMTRLPRVSQNNVGSIKHLVGNVKVTTMTGSGQRLQGIIFKRPVWFCFPDAARFVEVYRVQFQGKLLPRGSGSIVRNSETDVVYGHVVATWGHQEHMAYIIPATAVLDHLKSMMSEPQGQQTTPEGL